MERMTSMFFSSEYCLGGMVSLGLLAFSFASNKMYLPTFSVAAVLSSSLCGVVDVSLLRGRVVDILRVFWVRVLVVAPMALWPSGGLSLATGWMAAASASALMLWENLVHSSRRAAEYVLGRLVARVWLGC